MTGFLVFVKTKNRVTSFSREPVHEPVERVNDFETPAERIECRGVVQVCGLLADFRVG